MEKSFLRPLVLGSAGQLGSVLSGILAERYPSMIAASRMELDITDQDRLCLEIERLEPNVIINCAGITDVDGCERNPRLANRVNREGAGNLARAARAVGARLLHVSTDFVFDGAGTVPYREEEPAAPMSEYGKSKWEGEQAIIREHPDHLILRTSWLYGGTGGGFVRAILEKAKNKTPLQVVTDQVGGPTYRFDLANAICKLLSLPFRGILHFANSGQCSRFEFAKAILAAAGIPKSIEPIATILGPGQAVRPKFSVLDTSRYRELTGESIRDWKLALQDFLRPGTGP